MLKNADFNDQAMQNAGFNRLFDALLHLIQPALAYKQRKPAEALLHHLQEQILMPLQMELVPQLNQLQQDLNHARDTLMQSKEQIITQTWRGIIATLPGLLEQFAEQQAVDELYSTLTQQTEQLLSQQISDILVDYQLQSLPFEALQFAEHLTYEVIYADDAKEILAIGHDRLYTEISQTLWQKLDVYTDKIITQSQSVLSHIQDQIETVQQDLINDEQELQYIAQHLRMKDLEQA